MNDADYKFILKEEGGYVNDPSDSGGATNRGVIQTTYDTYRIAKGLPKRPVKLSTLEETRDIYSGVFRDCRADTLPAGLALIHFDFAINAGNRQAARTLQRAVGVTDDGIIGPKTIAAASTFNTKDAIINYAELRRVFYKTLAARRPKDQKFLKGWLLRTNRAEREALAQIREP